MRKGMLAGLLVVVAAVMGATVLREPIASAAQLVDAKIVAPLDGAGSVKVHEQGTAEVREQNLDRLGNIQVHEQGTASVEVTNADSAPVPVDVTNTDVPVEAPDGGLAVRQAGLPFMIKFGPIEKTFKVPSDKWLLIQYVNGPESFVLETWNGDPILDELPDGVFLFDAPAHVSEQTFISVPPGGTLVAKAFENFLEVTGYLIDN